MADNVRLGHPEVLLAFAADVMAQRTDLAKVGIEKHTALNLLGLGAGAMPPGVRQAIVDLWDANEGGFSNVALCATGLDQGLVGLAYMAAFVGIKIPEADAATAQRLRGLVDEARESVPAPPAGSDRDPRFISAVKPG